MSYTLVFSDNFTRANSTTVGNGWIDTGNKYQIVSNALVVNGSPTFGGDVLLRPSSENTSTSARSVLQLINGNGTGNPISINGIRWNSTAGKGYGVYWFNGVGIRIAKFSSGSPTDLVQGSVTLGDSSTYITTIAVVPNVTAGTDIVATVALAATPSTIIETINVTGDTDSDLQAHGQAWISYSSPTATSVTYFESDSGSLTSPLTGGTVLATAGVNQVVLSAVVASFGGTGSYTFPIYAGSDPTFTPGGGNLLASPSSFPYTDTSGSKTALTFYKVTVNDGVNTANQEPAYISGVATTSPLAIGSIPNYTRVYPTTISPAAAVFNMVFIGDSITNGYTTSSPGGSTAPPAQFATAFAAKSGISAVYVSNQGVGGSTTTGWLPASGNLTTAESAMTTLVSSHPTASQVFHIMLGTNDSAFSVTAATYYSNLVSIVNQLFTDFPTCKIILSNPSYYTPNAVNGSEVYTEGSLSLILQYRPQITALAAVYPGRVFVGDSYSLFYFAQNYSTNLTGESGTNGIYFLHPNNTGAAYLGGTLWADAIYSQLFQIPAGISEPTPFFTPPSGATILKGGSVLFGGGDPGTIYYYTIDGTTPTTSSMNGNAATNLSVGTVTIKMFAHAAGENDSSVVTATYTVVPITINSKGGLTTFTAPTIQRVTI